MTNDLVLWNLALSGVVAVLSFLIRAKFEELSRITILLNRTREEIARDHITRAEVRADMEKIRAHFDTGFERLEQKIDALASRPRGN